MGIHCTCIHCTVSNVSFLHPTGTRTFLFKIDRLKHVATGVGTVESLRPLFGANEPFEGTSYEQCARGQRNSKKNTAVGIGEWVLQKDPITKLDPLHRCSTSY